MQTKNQILKIDVLNKNGLLLTWSEWSFRLIPLNIASVHVATRVI